MKKAGLARGNDEAINGGNRNLREAQCFGVKLGNQCLAIIQWRGKAAAQKRAHGVKKTGAGTGENITKAA